MLNPDGSIAQFKRNRCLISPVEVIFSAAYAPCQFSNYTCQQTFVPPFFCQLFLCRLTAGRNHLIKGRFTITRPEFVKTCRLLNRCKYRRIKSKSTICGSCDLQLVLAAFQQSASLIAMQQDQRCPLRIISFRLNAFDTPIIRQSDIAATLDPLNLHEKHELREYRPLINPR